MSPIDAHSAAAALGLANSALSSVKTALELGKKTTDLELKRELSNAVDSVLDLKVKVHELADENRELRERLEQKEAITRSGQLGFWFRKGETDPLCPKCYEAENRLIYLTYYGKGPYNSPRYVCKVCEYVRYE